MENTRIDYATKITKQKTVTRRHYKSIIQTQGTGVQGWEWIKDLAGQTCEHKQKQRHISKHTDAHTLSYPRGVKERDTFVSQAQAL